MNDKDPEDDATLAALERYRAQGSDLSRPMTIDFLVAAPTPEAAEAVAQYARSRGFLGDRPNPANEDRLKGGQRRRR